MSPREPTGPCRTTGLGPAAATTPPFDQQTSEVAVSADTQELERSALERKDRDELHTIATALGGKPGSRAKKADIVDLILELAGVIAPARRRRTRRPTRSRAPRDGDRAPAPTSAPSRPADDAAGPRPRTAGRRRGPTDPPSAAAADDAGRRGRRPTADGPATPDARPAARRRRRADRGARRQPTRPERPRPRDRNRQRPAATRRASGQPGPSATRTRAGQGRAGAPEPAGRGRARRQGEAEGEAGNRRRRRRGRDRERGERPDQEQPFQGEPVEVEGLLDLRDEGYGFLRLKGYLPSKDDVYISVKQARQFALRKGDRLTGAARPAGRNEKNPALLRIDTVNGVDPEQARPASPLRGPHPAVPRRAAAASRAERRRTT